jgi:hypothetical protein
MCFQGFSTYGQFVGVQVALQAKSERCPAPVLTVTTIEFLTFYWIIICLEIRVFIKKSAFLANLPYC